MHSRPPAPPRPIFLNYYVDIVNITMYILLEIANLGPLRGIQVALGVPDVFVG